MKKFKISFMALSIVMMASFIAIPGGNTAQAIANPCYRFTQNLTVGSTGPDVAALQTWLVAHGFDIPTLKTDSTQIGYFGAQTKEAVMRYQASVGIPNTGFVGPMTREAINVGSCTSPTSGPSNSTASTTTSVVISLDAMNPISSTVVSEKDYTIGGLPVLIYDVTAVGGSATMVSSQIKFAIDGPGYISLARLYQGSNLIGSSAIKDGIAQFVNLNWSLPVSAKVPVLLKVDVVGVTASTTIRAQTVKLMFVNSKLSEIGSTGEAIGNKIMIVPVAGSIPSCDTINIGGYEYRLDPCHLDITMIDGQGDRSFLTKIITSSNSYMFSVYGYGEGFPTYSLIPSYSSGGASGNRTLPFLARDQFLNTDKINSKVFSGYVPIRIDSVSENGSGNDYLKLYVNVTVLPASMPTVPVTEGTISTYLTKDFGDYAGSYNKFSPGYGLGGLSQDWNWSMRVKIQGVSKSVKSISVTTDRGEVWTTNAAEFKGLPYPLVIRDSYGKQLNNSYETNNLLVLAGNSVEQTFRLSGQIETQTWPGGKVTIKFDDGSVLSGDIPASSYSPNSSQNNNIPEITNAYAGASDPLTIYRGETIYIYGSNFIGNNASSTTVYLQNALSPYSIPAVVTQIWTGNIHATAPTSLIPGETYDLYVANDLGTSTPIKVKVMGGAAASGAPVITGGSFPTYLNVGQVGTWSVNAYDPSNGPLSYSVRWGDMGGKGLMGGSEPFVQTATFTHSFAQSGVYTNVFTVKNGAGQSAETTNTVSVGVNQTGNYVSVTADSSAPLPSTIVISKYATTANVVLGIFDIKSKGASAYIRSLKLTNNQNIVTPNQVFNDIKLRVGSMTYSASAISDSFVYFTNLNIPIPADVSVPITVLGTVMPDTNNNVNGKTVSFTLNANNDNIRVETQNGVQILVASTSVTTPPITFTSNSAGTLSNMSARAGTCNSTFNQSNQNCNASFTFTITAASQPIYIANSNYPNQKKTVDLEVMYGIATLDDGAIMTAFPGYLAGDSSKYYVIAPGTSRTFIAYANVRQATCYGYCNVTVAAKAINYGKNGSDLYSGTFVTDASKMMVNFILYGNGTGTKPSIPSTNEPVSDATATFTVPVQTSTIAKLQANLLSSTDDKAGTWYVFNSGRGAGGQGTGLPDDWNVSATLTLSADANVQSITMTDTNNEYWSTDNYKYYPLVVIDQNGNKLTDRYTTQIGRMAKGTYSFKIYGQKNVTQWTQGYLIVKFVDGTVAVTPISASTSAAQSSVNIVRPSGGESWQSGTIQNLEFNISPIGPNEDIYLLPANCSPASTCSYTIYLGARGTLVYQGPIMWGWTVGRLADSSTVPSGSYQLKICVANTSACAISKPFTIVGSNSTAQSAINITAPYSNQQFVPGDTMRIKWSSQNVKVGAIDVMTQNQQTMLVSQSFGTDPGYYDFTLPSNLQMGTYTVRLRSTSGLNSSINFNVTRTSYPTVTPSPSIVALTASCYASVSNYGTPQATWVAAARGGSGQYQYSWSAYNDVSKYTGGDTRSYSFSASYSTSGTKQAVVRVVDASGNAATATCSGSIPTYQSSYTTSSVYSPTYTATPTATYSPTSTASPSPTYSPTYTASPSVTANPVIASCSGTASNNGTPTVTWNSNPSGGSTPYRYYWSMGGVTSIISGGTQSSSLTATYSSSGTVSASLRIVDNTGSLSSTSCSVTIPSYSSATPSVTVSPTSMNNQTNLNASIWDAVKQWFANQQ